MCLFDRCFFNMNLINFSECLLFSDDREDDDEDENTEAKGMQSLFSFFGKKEEDPKLSTHSFFKERSLQRVQCL